MSESFITPDWMIAQGFVATLATRFYKLVDRNGPTVRPDLGPCYVWKGTIGANGYGYISSGRKHKGHTAHRIAWMLEVGPIASVKQLVLHACDNRQCVRLSHLFLGNHEINGQDMTAKGRWGNGGLQGEEVGTSKLTTLQVREAIKLRRAGWTYKSIGIRFGVTLHAIHKICSGKNWKQVYTQA